MRALYLIHLCTWYNWIFFLPHFAERLNKKPIIVSFASFFTEKVKKIRNNLDSQVHVPVIKKQNLYPNVLQNYRPVSNIKVLAKFVEMAAASRLTEHLNSRGLTEKCS